MRPTCRSSCTCTCADQVGSAGTKEGEELVKKFGADEVCVGFGSPSRDSTDNCSSPLSLNGSQVVNHREPSYVEKLVELVPQGFDVILEMLANANLETDFRLAAKGMHHVLGFEYSRRGTAGQAC